MLLEENENRNCNCNNANNSCCQKNPTPSVSTYSFNFTNIMPEEFCAEEAMTRADMLHADDKRALALHKEYANEVRELSDKYQKVY